MSKYRVTVDGTSYDVVIEVVDETSRPIEVMTRSSAPRPAQTVNPVPVKAAATQAAPASTDKDVLAPMQGKIIDVMVNVGDQVQSGQVVAVLEAMKMENEIVAHEAGKVTDVKVNAGQSVEASDCIVSLS